MNQKEIDFLNMENQLLGVRKKLNDLIYEYNSTNQNTPETDNKALYQEKINFLDNEIQYLNRQLQMLKGMQSAQATQPEALHSLTAQPGSLQGQAVQLGTLQGQAAQPAASQGQTIQPGAWQGQPVQTGFQAALGPNAAAAKPRDYEKMFGRNFMGIFASVLIFISLIIFATLILPYLTDTMKLVGLYLVSFSILCAGLLLYKKNTDNKFYIAIIGCGAGSLYLSLLLSNIYFKVISDIVLYVFILVWAVFVKYLTRLKNLVFTIIGQAGILIATILGTVLCVHDKDAGKFLVLTIFYLISSFVYSGIGRAYLVFLTSHGDGEPIFYEDHLCNHLCKSLNVMVFAIGFAFMEPGGAKAVSIVLLMVFLLLEYYLSYKEVCRDGSVFQILTVVNAVLFVCLFHMTKMLEGEYSFVLLYIISIAILFYVNKKGAGYRLMSEICCFILVYIACMGNDFIYEHLNVYLTAIPFMLYGKIRKRESYLIASIVYTVNFLTIMMSLNSEYFLKPECLIMAVAIFAAFLFVCKGTAPVYFKVIGYPVLCITLDWVMGDIFCGLVSRYLGTYFDAIILDGGVDYVVVFSVVAVLHLILNKIEYFGREKPVEIMMLSVNVLLMLIGCKAMHHDLGKLPAILITVLLFCANSKKLLAKHKYMGYYVAFKYTVLLVCVLDSFEAANYAISISLLLFAIASIVAGFRKDASTFRLYGLVLSMISIFKLIMIDIKYDSTVENAVSFFVSGVLCFIISFIYHRIDTSFKKNNSSGTDEG